MRRFALRGCLFAFGGVLLLVGLPLASAADYTSIVDETGFANGAPFKVAPVAGIRGVSAGQFYDNFSTGNFTTGGAVWNFSGSNERSYAFWFRLDTNTTSSQALLDSAFLNCAGGASNGCNVLARWVASTGRVETHYWEGGVCTGRSVTSSTTYEVGVWYHLGFVYNGGTGGGRQFKNGTLDTTAGGTGTLCGNANTLNTLGQSRHDGYPASPCRCTLDDVRIWAGALSDPQMMDAYNGTEPSVASLRHSYQFESGFVASPTAPLNLTGFGALNYTTFNWSQPLSNGSSNVTSYHIYRNGSSLATIGVNFTYTDWGLAGDTTYAYCVAAINNDSLEGPSACVNLTTTRRPGNVTLTGTFVPCRTERLNWSESSNATSYIVRRTSALGLNTSWSVPPWGSASARMFNDTFPLANTTFFYTVAGVNAIGEGNESNIVNVTPARVMTLGDCGLQWGGLSEADFAGRAQLSVESSQVMLGIILVLVGSAVGFSVMGSVAGTAGGAIGGAVASIALGYLPVWILFFVGMLLVAGYVVAARGGSAARGAFERERGKLGGK